uniref:F-box domain-containing protein n=1 Tax=Mycena chlorophos TaxID=658473 RepID=A0ABQ0L3J7_MYCCL|nr:predicted protein [Mycena chlorophos]
MTSEKASTAAETRSTTIDELPPELLSLIFLLCVPDDFERTTHPEWILTINVCRRWREVALATPQFWANVAFHRDIAPLMLARARNAPLSVCLDLDAESESGRRLTWDERVDLVRGNWHRIETLHISGNNEILEAFIESLRPLANADATNALTNLAIANTTTGVPLFLDSAAILLCPSSDPERMRHLRLENCGLTWDSPWFSNLASLHLSDLQDVHGLTLMSLVDIIRACPLLRSLHLARTSMQLESPGWMLPIQMPHLEVVQILESITVCGWLLDTLRFQKAKQIMVEYLWGFDEVDTEMIPRFVHRQLVASYKTLDIKVAGHIFQLSATWNIPYERTLTLIIHDPNPVEVIGLVVNNGIIEQERAAFTHLRFLRLSLPKTPMFSDPQAMEELCQSPHLEHLSIDGFSLLLMLSLMLEWSMAQLSFSYRRPPAGRYLLYRQIFPRLRTLELSNVRLSSFGDTSEHPLLDTANLVRATLWARWAHRKPVSTLRISKCSNVIQADLAQFRYLVDNFVWDGEGLTLMREKEEMDSSRAIREFSLAVFQEWATAWRDA